MELAWYLTIIRRYGWLLLLGTLVPGLVALGITMTRPKTYQAQAELVLFRSAADVNFDPRFETVSEDQSINFNNPQDPRRQTMAGLAASDAVLQQTLDNMPESQRALWSLGRLKSHTEVNTVGNLVQLAVTTTSPETSAAIANLWARSVASFANQVPQQGSDPSSVQGQVANARAEYDAAQAALEEMLGDNRINELNLEISLRNRAIDDLQRAVQAGAENALATQLTVTQSIPLLLANVAALQQVVGQADGSAPVDSGTQLALMTLESGALTGGVALPASLQFSLSGAASTPASNAEAVALLGRLEAALRQLEAAGQESVAERAAAVLDVASFERDHQEQLQRLHDELNRLQLEIEQELARRRELTTARDNSWEDYVTLRRKASELLIANQVADTEVVVAAPAVPPDVPSGPSLLINTALGLILGLALSTGLAVTKAHIDGVGVGAG